MLVEVHGAVVSKQRLVMTYAYFWNVWNVFWINFLRIQIESETVRHEWKMAKNVPFIKMNVLEMARAYLETVEIVPKYVFLVGRLEE